jgi:hypothetical protein
MPQATPVPGKARCQNLEIENKHNQRQSNRKLALNLRLQYTVYREACHCQRMLAQWGRALKVRSSTRQATSPPFFSNAAHSGGWRKKGLVRRNPKPRHPFPDPSTLATYYKACDESQTCSPPYQKSLTLLLPPPKSCWEKYVVTGFPSHCLNLEEQQKHFFKERKAEI